MNEENIFKLLLIILLMSNNFSTSDCGCKSLWGSINDVILMALLLGLTGDGSTTASTETPVTTFS